ncbi:MAG TPA: 16S rRNA (cytosine(1402)-N(4))-methyltransferase RsmH [Thermoanaerobacterales bacterium]|nr:16S rRNA (cytosine(1402)-N(4))-methyltransferase RsmH [Thermoanaerobacterales bacterium]
MAYYHESVLLKETIDLLDPKPGGIYIDGTLGGGGHLRKIIEKVGGRGKFIGIDRDKDSIMNAKKTFPKDIDIVFVHDNFKNILDIAKRLGLKAVDGIIFDLGVSSYQLDDETRGFSYMKNAPLDMRMNQEIELTAKDVVNTRSKEELQKIISEYGEELWAARIAEFICERRKEKPIETTFELVEVIKAAIPAGARKKGPHPAKRTFQAIRIFVNNELNILETAIKDSAKLLSLRGKICIISFHSLEDRIVKNTFRELASDCICPKDIPVCICNHKRTLKIITSKPVCPSKDEITINPRSRSAKLRVAEKIRSSK